MPTVARAILARDRRALARAITAVENRDPSSVPVVRALYPHTGHARVIGLTGPLGVGKSSVINALIHHLRGQHRTVAIIAVDPSSPFSGGSVLGDRIRIDRASGDDGIFFRSMASRGHAGGISAATREVLHLLDAFGFDVVLIETVGSGQVDVEIRQVATTSVVVLVPHLGDEVQTLKAGLFEIADVFCVNKADLPGAELAAKDLGELVGLGEARDGWAPPIILTSTQDARGIPELWTAIEAHETYLDASGRRAKAMRLRIADEIIGIVRDRVGRDLTEEFQEDPDLNGLLAQVVDRKIDPHAAADRLYAQRIRAPK
ncbi:MAG: methylmalonyl Co-A mutase-associated GTPase MeaB [Thermoplasmata archaeon]